MTAAFRARLIGLVAALAMVAGFTLWGVQRSWSQISQLEHRLTAGHLESFRLADDFQGRLHKLNTSMMRYAARRDAQQWNEFKEASDNLNAWIDQHDARLNPDSKLTTARERELFQRLNDAYDEYLTAAQEVRTNQQPPSGSSGIFVQLRDFERQSERLMRLGIELADAHREAEDAFLIEANRSLGKLRTFLFSGVTLMLALVAILGVVIYRDMIAPLRTRLVQSEQLLERQEKLATLGTLAAGIAHEIRNPLTSIKARLYTLGKHIRGNEAGIADTGIISSEISRLESIVQGVLQFARPSDPHVCLSSVNTLLEEVRSLMGEALEKSGVKLVVDVTGDLEVPMDGAHIKQVLINLVRNAAEATEGAGTVTLRARAAQAPLGGQTRPVVILEVHDTGTGMAPEVEKRLFDPFFTTKDTGTGLGLPIAARIVEKHGGTLQYQTQPGRGTTFGVVLPRASAVLSAAAS